MTINVVSEWRWAWQCDTLWQCNIRPPPVPTLAPFLSSCLHIVVNNTRESQLWVAYLLTTHSNNPNSQIFYFLSHISELEPLLRLNWLITSRSQWFCCRSVIRGRCCVVQSWKQILGPRHQQYQECEHWTKRLLTSLKPGVGAWLGSSLAVSSTHRSQLSTLKTKD